MATLLFSPLLSIKSKQLNEDRSFDYIGFDKITVVYLPQNLSATRTEQNTTEQIKTKKRNMTEQKEIEEINKSEQKKENRKTNK